MYSSFYCKLDETIALPMLEPPLVYVTLDLPCVCIGHWSPPLGFYFGGEGGDHVTYPLCPLYPQF